MSRTIIITGCSTGFGHSAALRFARRGDRVYATMRGVDAKNHEKAEALREMAAAEELDLRVLEMDVTSNASVNAAAQTVLSESGAPDVVINNAGQMYVGIAEAYTSEEFARQMDVNVLGIHRVSRAFLPAMRQRGSGLFINVSSVAGRFGAPFFAVYNASKWAVEGYSLGSRGELASSGVDVVVVEPGPFSTELFPQAPAPADVDGVAAGYPAGLHEAFEGMGAAFEEMFAGDEVDTDPETVVDSFENLVDMEAGTRPFRTVVGFDFGVVRPMNEFAAGKQAELMTAMGMAEVTKLVAGE
ncbi:MAG: SDR family oxidoreductase [marine benthic group bacterium]|nr:SDR family oxidoreductase [Gemmatimonadota bacterium]MCL7969172.1 SDR family oxidoreductase [Gemmatimonadota bacterium]